MYFRILRIHRMILNERKTDPEVPPDCLRMMMILRYFGILRILKMIMKEKKKDKVDSEKRSKLCKDDEELEVFQDTKGP